VEETAKAIGADGWVHPRGLAIQNESDYYCISGRSADTSMVGDENLSPA
jgi:acyl-CoA synthetase (AMP-forming)/AMP-acid ligase II